MVIKKGFDQDPHNLELFKEFAAQISRDVYGSAPVDIHLCDEYLKNSKGYLGLTPIEPVSAWRIQHEQDPVLGLTVYFTPVKGMPDPHVLPIAVRWNPKTKRYQSLDRSYQQFLVESPSLSNARSRLR